MKSRYLSGWIGTALVVWVANFGHADGLGTNTAPRVSDACCAVGKHEGIIDMPAHHSVDNTVAKLTGILAAKHITLFAVIDHSGEAAKVGLKMPPTKLVIFGNPKGGTPLMLTAPRIAIDLPLKILIWADAQGKVWVSYNSPAYLQQRHGLPDEMLKNIAVVTTLAAAAAE